MKIQDRQYQTESVNQLAEGFKQNQRQVFVLPTGGGKTVVFCNIALRAAIRGTKTLILTHREELFKQTFKSLGRVGVGTYILDAKSTRTGLIDEQVIIGMVETVKRRISSGKIQLEPQLIIIDEAHLGNFTKIFTMFPNSKVIGATATPIGKHFYKYYTSMVNVIDIPELIEQGYLMPYRAFQMQEDLSDLEVKRGEYTDESLMNHYNDQKLFDGVIDEWRKKANGLKTICFNVNIEHAENMTKAFNDAGIVSACITSKTDKLERIRTLKAFKDGYISVLQNCGVLTTGYDEPSIKCVIMNRATKSLALFLQCLGRGSRVHEGKDEFLVLDFGLNHNQHGMWSEPRNWTLKPPKKKQDKTDVAPVKSCPSCEALIFASARVCRYCAHEFPIDEKELAEGKMVEVTPKIPDDLVGKAISELSLGELVALQTSKKYKPTFIWRVVRSKGKEAIDNYARTMGYSTGWAFHQKQEMDNCAFNDYKLR